MMQFSDEWHWSIGGFLFAGAMIGTVGLIYELAERASGAPWAAESLSHRLLTVRS